ncbi:MAG: glycoside hydrolase family 92 protein [Deltaproteobacteria bacterium]|nr:glycoside hydrolase family 92 protein [Deltaproteobacteria bacterium]
MSARCGKYLEIALLFCCVSALFAACGDGRETTPDAGLGDVAIVDTGAPDSGITDAGVPDAGTDAGQLEKLTSYVDPFIGTGGVGFGVGQLIPGATMPFGMVKVSPDTTERTGAVEFYHCAGYYYYDPYVLGFSHNHLPGVGTADLGNVLFMPMVAMDEKMTRPSEYRAPLDHATELAVPGYYSVKLPDRDVTAELTATTHAALHRYTFASGSERFVLIDLDHMASSNTQAFDEHITIDTASGSVSGDVLGKGSFSGGYGGLRVYFHAVFSAPIFAYGTWTETGYVPGTAQAAGDAIGAFVGFGPSDGAPIMARVGMSYISAEQAKANLEVEIPSFDFDAVRAAADAAWEAELSVARVEGGTAAERTMFYTALYHVFQLPTVFGDANGKYLGFDGQVHDAPDFTYYTDFSLWDTYRTLHPLLTLIAPDRTREMIVSLIKMYEQGGAFPRWPMGTGESGSMVGDSFSIVIADAFVKGVTDFDVDTAWEGMLPPADGPMPPGTTYGGRGGIEDYLALGYVAADHDSGSVSETQEYAYNDFAIAQLAAALGKTADQERFTQRAGNYKNVFHPESKFFRGRNADGTWVEDFSETGWKDYYVEGNAWQYRFFVPHDVPGLAALFGGPAALVAELDRLFALSKAAYPDEKGSPLFPKYYWQGNEIDIHTAYVYAEAGRPDLTAEWARWVMRSWYGADPDGIPGNDDGGTMSAWLMFAMMGFYPVPARDIYVVGSPVFTKVTLNLKGGTFVIEAPGASRNGKYVQEATLDGAALDRPWFSHTAVASGARLRLEMGATPSDWGKF